MQYKAVMMDYDGTVTEKGQPIPPKEMLDKIIRMTEKIPVAFCTGRQLESFEKHGLKTIIENIEASKRVDVLKNIFLIAENGSMGYFFNKNTQEYEEFYRVGWPDNFVKKSQLMEQLQEEISDYGKVYSVHRVVLVMGAHFEDRDIEKTYKRSAEIHRIVEQKLSAIDPEFEKYLHIGDSGIGVIVCPANGDKDTGIKRFAEFLSDTRGIHFDSKASEILVIGDSAKKGGNDFYFLQGKYGTPYTVGDHEDPLNPPSPVLSKSGKRLFHVDGTISLLDNIFPF